MMTFEKDFPSLKELRMEGFVEDDGDLGYSLEDNGNYIQVYDVKKYCLDRQRVKEVIENMAHGDFQSEKDVQDALKELGLNDTINGDV